MTYEATVEFKFDATWTPTYKSGFGSTVEDDFIPEEHYVITAPAADLNCRQYFKLFEKFMLCVGMDPTSIRSGAMSLVFNDWTNEADQRKVCKEYELTMDEDLHKKFEEWKELEDASYLNNKINRVSDNVEAMYWKNKYIAELEAQGKLDTDHQPVSHQDDDIDSANGVA